MRHNRGLILILITFILIVLAAILYWLPKLRSPRTSAEITSTISITKGNMKITSTAFQNNQPIPSKYTCDAADINPPLEFSEIPENTQTLALIVDDPDAPAGTWVHWTVINMTPATTGIQENSKPDGMETTTSGGKTGWGGPCPPSGTHRYYFKLYALDTVLNLDESAKKQDIENAMKGHVLSSAELMGTYKRS